MEIGICFLSMIPVREKPSDKSQMINQLLFGEMVRIKDHFMNWLLVEGVDDQYSGWVDEKQIKLLEGEYFKQHQIHSRFYVGQSMAMVQHSGRLNHLSIGSCLPDWDGKQFKQGGESYTFVNAPVLFSGKKKPQEIAGIARLYLGSPYLWGGRSIFGIDCSGFTQMVFKMAGYLLPRDSSVQAGQGVDVDFIHEAKSGDLAFFEDEEGQIIHVGILLDKETIIHSSGQVRIDPIDHEGIYNEDLKKYTHKLRVIKRITHD